MPHIKPSSLSLYVHIPFCRKKCRYCDFYSSNNVATLGDEYIAALGTEWERVRDDNDLENVGIDTLYFGGGTPSMLLPDQWEQMHRAFSSRLTLAPGYEWSVEGNPDSFTNELVRVWRGIGVNRVTLGIQSLDDRELSLLGRPHTSAQALAALQRAVAAGFSSVGADVMYALPGQTIQGLTNTLQQVLNTGINHLSVYELTIAADTPFGRHRTLVPLPQEDVVLDMGDLIIAESAARGLMRYEVSNYAQSGHQSRHNSAYWTHKPYIGLGPSAHSYLHPHRWANIADTAAYIGDIHDSGTGEAHRETIGRHEVVAECIFLGLRTVAGIDGDRFKSLTGEQFDSGPRSSLIRRLVRAGTMIVSENCFALSPDGMNLADSITRELL